jgi:hypothetical protein
VPEKAQRVVAYSPGAIQDLIEREGPIAIRWNPTIRVSVENGALIWEASQQEVLG